MLESKATETVVGPRALVVEDERDMNTLITYHLEKNGIHTIGAMDGEIGLLLAMRNHFDVVILDLMLPSMSGLEVCRQIRARCRPLPPVIIITAVSTEVVRSLGDKLQAVEVLHKPFKPAELVQLVRNLLHLTGENPRPAGEAA